MNILIKIDILKDGNSHIRILVEMIAKCEEWQDRERRAVVTLPGWGKGRAVGKFEGCESKIRMERGRETKGRRAGEIMSGGWEREGVRYIE